MKTKIILALTIILLFKDPVFSEATIGEKVIGKTIKTVVRLVVVTTNLEKVKKRLVNKLRAIGDEEFRARYVRFYELIKDLPRDIKAT